MPYLIGQPSVWHGARYVAMCSERAMVNARDQLFTAHVRSAGGCYVTPLALDLEAEQGPSRVALLGTAGRHVAAR
jgi:hypothetical protein